jgi:hypothetical protein
MSPIQVVFAVTAILGILALFGLPGGFWIGFCGPFINLIYGKYQMEAFINHMETSM